MYLYFDNTGKLRTKINHGEVPRQNSDFNLYVCFDRDFFENHDFFEQQNREIEKYPLYFKYLKPSSDDWTDYGVPLTYLGANRFHKSDDNEVTFNLEDGKRYLTYKINIPTIGGVLAESGELGFVFAFYNSEQQQISTEITIAANIFVEATYGDKKIDYPDLDKEDYDKLVDKLTEFSANKNILKTTEISGTFASKLSNVYEKYRVGKSYIGWVVIAQDDNANQTDLFYTAQNYIIGFDSSTGIWYKYVVGEEPIQLTLGQSEAVFDIKYEDGTIKFNKKGENYTDVVNVNTLKTDMSLNEVTNQIVNKMKDDISRQGSSISNIEKDAIYDVNYNEEGGLLTKQVGKDGNEQKLIMQNLYPSISDLNEVTENNSAQRNLTQYGAAKLRDKLQEQINELRKFFTTFVGPDADNTINKIEELFDAFQDVEEGAGIVKKLDDLINQLYAMLGDDKDGTYFIGDEIVSKTVKTRLLSLESNHKAIINVDMRDDPILNTDWQPYSEHFATENGLELYSGFKSYAVIQNDLFKGAGDVEVEFSAEASESGLFGTVADLDPELGQVYIYAKKDRVDLPEETLINEIKIVSVISILDLNLGGINEKILKNEQMINANKQKADNNESEINNAKRTIVDLERNKVDKTDVELKVYATNRSGVDEPLSYSMDILPQVLVQRDNDGAIVVPNPNHNLDATNKKYVDDNLANLKSHLDGSIATSKEIADKGSNWSYKKIATLPAQHAGDNGASIVIHGSAGGWYTEEKLDFYCIISTRNTVKMNGWTNGVSQEKFNIDVYQNSDGTYDVCLALKGYVATNIEYRASGELAFYPNGGVEYQKAGEPVITLTSANLVVINYIKNKLDKTSTANRIYATDVNGNQSTLGYTNANVEWTLMQRGADGVVNVGTPTADTHATTKKYVDDKIVTSIEGYSNSDDKVISVKELYRILLNLDMLKKGSTEYSVGTYTYTALNYLQFGYEAKATGTNMSPSNGTHAGTAHFNAGEKFTIKYSASQTTEGSGSSVHGTFTITLEITGVSPKIITGNWDATHPFTNKLLIDFYENYNVIGEKVK